jgi:hypothetical protein
LWLARFNQRIFPLNQSLRDLSIYYLLLKALESRVHLHISINKTCKLWDFCVCSLPNLHNVIVLSRFSYVADVDDAHCRWSLMSKIVYVLSSLISNNGIADVSDIWESGFNAAKNDTSSGSALENLSLRKCFVYSTL